MSGGFPSFDGDGDRVASLEAFFQQVPHGSRLAEAMPDGVAIGFDLLGSGGGCWTVTRAGHETRVAQELAARPDCTLRCSVGDFRELLEGTLDPRRGFLDDRLTVQGDVGLVLRLYRILARDVDGP